MLLLIMKMTEKYINVQEILYGKTVLVVIQKARCNQKAY